MQTFAYCSSLTGVTIPEGVTVLGNNLFAGCTSLANVGLPEGIVSIGSSAFDTCLSLKNVTIPPTVKTIGNFAFIYCSGLTGIAIPEGVTSIGNSCFADCSSLAVLELPSTLTAIGTFAFMKCTALPGVTLQEGLISLSNSSFERCSSLASVTIPSSVTQIGNNVFRFCSALSEITIPAGVTSIGDGAFAACGQLAAATFKGNAPAAFGINVFYGTAAEFVIRFYPGPTGFTTPTWQTYPAVQIGYASPQAAWLAGHGLPVDSDLNSDSNGDGVSLLMAYALNLNPHLNLGGSLPGPVLTAGQLNLSFHAGAAGITYVVETCTDLTDWTTEGVSLSAPDENQVRTATVDRSGPCRFMRLVVSN
jgi:hypothetical protein